MTNMYCMFKSTQRKSNNKKPLNPKKKKLKDLSIKNKKKVLPHKTVYGSSRNYNELFYMLIYSFNGKNEN